MHLTTILITKSLIHLNENVTKSCQVNFSLNGWVDWADILWVWVLSSNRIHKGGAQGGGGRVGGRFEKKLYKLKKQIGAHSHLFALEEGLN